MRGRQVQFLPIQWRASLKLTHSSAEAQEDIDHELHNRCASISLPTRVKVLLLTVVSPSSFTLDDITLKKSIPYVRELTNSTCPGVIKWQSVLQLTCLLPGGPKDVLIDIPYVRRPTA